MGSTNSFIANGGNGFIIYPALECTKIEDTKYDIKQINTKYHNNKYITKYSDRDSINNEIKIGKVLNGLNQFITCEPEICLEMKDSKTELIEDNIYVYAKYGGLTLSNCFDLFTNLSNIKLLIKTICEHIILLHSKNVYHLDIHPGNIVINLEKKKDDIKLLVYIIDFGTSLLLENKIEDINKFPGIKFYNIWSPDYNLITGDWNRETAKKMLYPMSLSLTNKIEKDKEDDIEGFKEIYSFDDPFKMHDMKITYETINKIYNESKELLKINHKQYYESVDMYSLGRLILVIILDTKMVIKFKPISQYIKQLMSLNPNDRSEKVVMMLLEKLSEIK